MGWRAVVAVLVLGGGMLPAVSASADVPDVADDIPTREAQPFERAEAVVPSTTYEGWGRFSVDGDYAGASVLAGSHVVVALAGGRTLVRYDFDTNELQTGPQVPGGQLSIFPSVNGRWVWTSEFIEEDDTWSLRFRRYRADDLVLDSAWTYEMGRAESGRPIAAADPTDDDRVLVLGHRYLAVVEDGVELPDTEPAVASLLAFAEVEVFESGFASTTVEGVHFLHEIGETGIVSTERFDFDEDAVRWGTVPDGLVIGDTLIVLPGLEERPVTDFDRAIADPDLDLRFGAAVFDEATGDVLPPGKPCEGRGEPVGDGWWVDSDMAFVNVLLRCGAYGEFTPVQPDRVFDSRVASGELGAGQPLEGGTTRRIRIHGLAGVPDTGVESVVLNVTAVNQRGAAPAANYVTVWPAGFEQPTVANLNIRDGDTVGNMVTVSTAAGGFVDVYSNAGTVDLTVDVLGYFASSIAPAGARFLVSAPSRELDTREQGARVQEGEQFTIDVLDGRAELLEELAGRAVPRAEVTAVVMAVTAVQPSRRGFLRISPAGSPRPEASAMNFEPGTNTNRLVTVEVDDGEVDILNEIGSTHLTIDIVGFYVEGGRLGGGSPIFDVPPSTLQNGRFIGYVPFRALDTRVSSPFEDDGRIPGGFRLIQSGWGIGTTLVTNLTAVRPTQTGYMSTLPITTSSLNFGPGDIIANQSVIPVSPTGDISVFNSAGLAHFTLDVFGVYTETDAQAAANPPL